MICFPLDNTEYEAKDMGAYLVRARAACFLRKGTLPLHRQKMDLP